MATGSALIPRARLRRELYGVCAQRPVDLITRRHMDSSRPPVPAPSADSPATGGSSHGSAARLALRQPPQRVPDMEHFAALLNRQLGYCRRSGSRMALLLLQGEPVAESVELLPALREDLLWEVVGVRLVNRVRATDVVCRIGESCFAVVLMGAGRHEAEIVRARLLKVLAGPYGIEQRTLGLALQVGMGVFRECGHTGAELTGAAERALGAQRRADLTVARNGEDG